MRFFLVPEQYEADLKTLMQKMEGKRDGAVILATEGEIDAMRYAHIVDVPEAPSK